MSSRCFSPESNSQHLIRASSLSRWNKKNKEPFDAPRIERLFAFNNL